MVENKTKVILAIISLFISAGFEVSGYENLKLAYLLWSIAGILILWASLPYLNKFIKQNKSLKESPIKIEYKKNDPRYYSEIRYEPLYKISINNTYGKTIEDVSIEITDMTPPHAVFKAHPIIPLKQSIKLHPGEIFIDVVKWKWNGAQTLYEFFSCDPAINSNFVEEGQSHRITITVKGKDVLESKNFYFGVKKEHKKGTKLWFKPAIE